jgi:hypothetical protein
MAGFMSCEAALLGVLLHDCTAHLMLLHQLLRLVSSLAPTLSAQLLALY